MQAFVTGGTGFIGANLVEKLNQEGIPVRVLCRPTSSLAALAGLDFELATGDVLDEPEKLARLMAGCDWVFHVAAVADYWRQSREWLYRVNVDGTRHVLAAAKLAGAKRFVFTSSLAAMGIPKPGEMLTEASTFNLEPAQFPYGHSKSLAEQAVLEAASSGLAAVIVNPTVVLGPRDLNVISGSLILEAAKGRVRFAFPGGVNYVAAADVAAGHLAAADSGRVGERYILAGQNVSHREALALICRVVGQPPPRRTIPGWVLPLAAWGVAGMRWVFGNRVPLDANQVRLAGVVLYADGRKAVSELGLPQTSFETAVKSAYAWYDENGFLDKT
ncbi:MAG: NAD-dependent epimerase/dehydratase family protein [Anaerolineae bacterium]